MWNSGDSVPPVPSPAEGPEATQLQNLAGHKAEDLSDLVLRALRFLYFRAFRR
jgi:hypothetical protein